MTDRASLRPWNDEVKNPIDYYPNSVTTLCRRIWMSFFDTEEVHAVMPDKVADRGGRAALKVTPTPEDVDIYKGDRRPPGSSVKSTLKAPAQFGAKKASISFTVASSSRMDGNSSCCGAKAIIEKPNYAAAGAIEQ